MFDADGEPPLRVAADRRNVDDWALALTAVGIDVSINETDHGVELYVTANDRARASAILAAYDAENRPPEPPPAEHDGSSYGAYVAAVLLAAFFSITGPRDAGGRQWFDRGAASGARIADGEIWRTVTALTLHADAVHILGNSITLIVFGSSICGALGTGVGLWVMLLAGALGNAADALLRSAPYSSVGASTSIFGGIGALAAIQFVRRRDGIAISRWRMWAPVGAGLALLGFLGTSPESDILAHLFGFVAGMALAFPAMRAIAVRDSGVIQAALSVAALALVIGCWLRALR
jgi:membrane associated rhomboid family serine protease